MEDEGDQPGEQIFRNGKADKRLTRTFEVGGRIENTVGRFLSRFLRGMRISAARCELHGVLSNRSAKTETW